MLQFCIESVGVNALTPVYVVDPEVNHSVYSVLLGAIIILQVPCPVYNAQLDHMQIKFSLLNVKPSVLLGNMLQIQVAHPVYHHVLLEDIHPLLVNEHLTSALLEGIQLTIQPLSRLISHLFLF